MGAEHRDAALAHAGQIAHRLLEVVGVEVAAGADDHLLRPPGEIELAVGQVAVVAGGEPAVADQCGGGRRIAVIAGGGRGAAELHRADGALGQGMALGVDDA